MARTGVVDVSLREVAAAVGVTHAAAYRHFQGKVDLLAEVACRGFRRLRETLEEAMQGRSGEEAVVTAGTSYVLFALEHPGLFRVMFHPTLKPFADHPNLLTEATQSLGVLRRLLVELDEAPVAEGELATRTMTAWAIFHGQAMLQLDQQLAFPFGVGPAEAASAARAVFGILVQALKTRDGAASPGASRESPRKRRRNPAK